MMSATEAFFDGLARRRHEPLLEKVSGTIRVDLNEGQNTQHWFVTIANGDVWVKRDGAEVNAIFTAPAPVFEKMASGEMNGMAAILRGEAGADGDLELAVLLQRLLPGPPRSKQPQTKGRSAAADPRNVKPGTPRVSAGYPNSSVLTVGSNTARAEERR
jgi:hypothetical protein